MRSTTVVLSACAVSLLALACGGGDSTAPATGVVQIAGFSISPQAVDCGFAPSPTNLEIGAPDTVLLSLHVVNTTKNDETLVTTGSYGTILSGSGSNEAGTLIGNLPILPHNPDAVLVRAKDGDVHFTISMPTGQACRVKPNGYFGTAVVAMTARLELTSGVYSSQPIVMQFNWH